MTATNCNTAGGDQHADTNCDNLGPNFVCCTPTIEFSPNSVTCDRSVDFTAGGLNKTTDYILRIDRDSSLDGDKFGSTLFYLYYTERSGTTPIPITKTYTFDSIKESVGSQNVYCIDESDLTPVVIPAGNYIVSLIWDPGSDERGALNWFLSIEAPNITGCTLTPVVPFDLNQYESLRLSFAQPETDYTISLSPETGCTYEPSVNTDSTGFKFVDVKCSYPNTYTFTADEDGGNDTCSTTVDLSSGPIITPPPGTCGGENEPCCSSDPTCDAGLECIKQNGSGYCAPDFGGNDIGWCDQFCTEPAFPYGTCGTWDPLNTNCPRPPDDEGIGQIDCSINGAIYDCLCCNDYIPFREPLPPAPGAILPTCDVNTGEPDPDGTGILTAIGCIPANDTNELTAFILRWALGIGGGIAFLLIIYSGFIITTSAGNPERVQAGKELLTAAIAGLMLIIFSVFLLDIIGVRIFRLPGF
jgi:hypothetical protein